VFDPDSLRSWLRYQDVGDVFCRDRDHQYQDPKISPRKKVRLPRQKKALIPSTGQTGVAYGVLVHAQTPPHRDDQIIPIPRIPIDAEQPRTPHRSASTQTLPLANARFSFAGSVIFAFLEFGFRRTNCSESGGRG
jgi:hypothetical protein